ncbi:MAG: bifunctional 4-hydroxy-2-oxoglutarate aldolase/2-dehydro-3-deoxy-phosphogluconate aldolase [Cyanobacteria bacterium J06642_2]
MKSSLNLPNAVFDRPNSLSASRSNSPVHLAAEKQLPQEPLWIGRLKRDRAIAVVRADDTELALTLAEIALAAGMHHVEIISTTPQFGAVIARLRARYPEQWVGAGTVVNIETARAAIEAGAQFLFSPYRSAEVVELARASHVPIVPGALTPQEIGSAWDAGAAAVKVFPIGCVGGADYLQALRAPLAGIPLIPTGGVTIDNAGELLKTGAIAVGLATQLFPKDLVAREQWKAISDRICNFVDCLPT